MSAKSFKAECEAKVLRYVEELLERNITEKQLINSAEIFSASQYGDVVEERNIEHLCGYPLCNAPMSCILEQKYHVSVKNKQVYDLTERKKFCSEMCFKYSQYFEAQLSPLPLWSRRDSKKMKIKLLVPKSSQSADLTQSFLSSPSSPPTAPAKNRVSSSRTHIPPLMSELPKIGAIKEHQSQPQAPDSEPSCDVSDDDDDNVPTLSHDVPLVSHVSKLLNAFSTWASFSNSTIQSHDLDEESHDEHKRETKQEEVSREEEQDSRSPAPVFLPPVDSVDTKQLQHRIFASQMRKYLSTVCPKIGLSLHTVLPKVIHTISTFRFNRHCITFQSSEWKIIILVLITISCKDLDVLDNAHVDQWLQDIHATRTDLKLMLTSLHK